MSKLAHSNDETMHLIDIVALRRDVPLREFYQLMRECGLYEPVAEGDRNASQCHVTGNSTQALPKTQSVPRRAK